MRRPANEVQLADFDRIGVFGASGSGKSTLAKRVADQTERHYLAMDPLNFLPDWVERPLADAEQMLREMVREERWVSDGNYAKLRHIIGPRVQLVIWLDYSFARVLWQLLLRTVVRSAKKEELWPGCRETWRMSFFSRESILLWMIKTHGRKRRELRSLEGRPEWDNITVVSFRNPNQTDRWLLQNGLK